MAKALPVILLFLSLCSCSAWGSRDAFYRGLRLKTESAAQEQSEKTKLLNEARAFFEKALNSRNVYIRRAASTGILDLLYDGHAVSRQVLRRIQREPPGGSWAAAFDVLETLPEGRRRKSPSEADLARVREKALAFLLDAENFTGENAAPGFTGAFPDTAAFYVLRECLAFDPGIFSPAESATIDGHFAALRSRFGEALARFRVTLETPPRPGNSDNPAAFAELPAGADLFFRYPGLLNSLGRAFQYGSSDGEGIDLFLEWERIAGRENITQNTGEIRFKLLFFAGRIARQRGRLREGVSLFERALPFAPDSTQSDACIWYILDSALSLGTDIMLEKLPLLITQWHDKAYFYDVLDKLTAVLAASRRWNDIASVFPFIRDYADNASVAKYAYITGRALEDGLLSIEESGETAADPVRAFMETAYNSSGGAYYYRAKSAAALGKPFELLPPQPPGSPPKRQRTRDQAEMVFLRGFFTHQMAEFAPRYIRALDRELDAGEKQILAEALGEAGLYAESIRLISSFLERDGGQPSRENLETYFPRPFRELTEKYAAECNLAPELLFGLIRTESAFQSGVISRAGAVGLTQLMPATAQEMADRIRRRGGPDYTPIDEAALQESETNIHIGAVYLRYLMDRMESPLLSLLAYNGGMNRVRRWRGTSGVQSEDGQAVFDLSEDLFLETIEYQETREYGRRVSAAEVVYRILYYGFD